MRNHRLQCHRTSDGHLDGTADHWGFT